MNHREQDQGTGASADLLSVAKGFRSMAALHRSEQQRFSEMSRTYAEMSRARAEAAEELDQIAANLEAETRRSQPEAETRRNIEAGGARSSEVREPEGVEAEAVWLTVSEVAETLRVSNNRVYDWIGRGLIEARRFGS